jgi:cell fate (sporulation/competence/biofilm development) regulator YlbF (YheA/YmcA/DUF963 family)
MAHASPNIDLLLLGVCGVLSHRTVGHKNANNWQQSIINMQTQIEESAVIQKTRELCQAILDQPEVVALRQKIDAFTNDDQARGEYDALTMKGQLLQQKQQAGLALDDMEIKDFELNREAFLNNPIARGFLDAQEEMQKVKQSVSQYVSKTFELGRVPEESDLESGCCGGGGGGGCGCH